MKPFALLSDNAPAKPVGKTELQRVWIKQDGKLVSLWTSVSK